MIKMKLILIFFLLGSFSNSFSQVQWEQLGPDGGYYYEISNDNKGNLYTHNGTVMYKSTNNGETWNIHKVPFWGYVNRYFMEMYVHKSGKIFVLVDGYSPIDSAFVSDESGQNWKYTEAVPRQAGQNGELYGINNQKEIMTSTNIGETWQKYPSPTSTVHNFLFIDSQKHIIISTTGTMYSTIDGGKTYKESKLQIGGTKTQIFFDSRNNLFLLNYAKFQISKDFGQTWADLTVPAAWNNVSKIEETDAHELLLFIQNNIYKSTDSGTSWKLSWQLSANLVNLNNIPGVGLFSTLNGTGIYKFNLATNNWEKKNSGLFIYNGKINKSGNNLFLCNSSKMYKSTDLGKTWNNIAPVNYISKYSFYNSGIISILLAGARIMLSFDEGNSWKEIINPISNTSPAFHCVSPNLFVCYSNASKSIYLSENQQRWYPVRYFGEEELFDVGSFASKSEKEIYFSYGNKIYLSTNQGRDWKLLYQFEKEVFHIDLIASEYGPVFAKVSPSSGPTRMYNLNSGVQEPIKFPGTTNSAPDIKFSSEGTIYFSTGTAIYESKDFGKTNRVLVEKYPELIYSFEVVNNNIYVLSNYPGVLKTEFVPKTDTKYSQSFITSNYPNPFNSSTVIEFYVKDTEKLELKVYDLLGREVDTITSKIHSPGYYQYSWYPQNLASGIYFYRLTSGSYSETKKLILMK